MAFSYKIMKIFAIRRARYSVLQKGRGILSLLHMGRLAARAPSNIAAIVHYVFPHARLGIWPTLKKAEFLQYIFFFVAACRTREQSARVFLRGRCRLFETIEKRNEREIWIG